MKKPDTCQDCVLEKKGISFTLPDGTGENKVLVIGESAGRTEAREGVPFVGQAGVQLNRSISRQKYERDDFAFYNLIQCQPPNNWLDNAPWQRGAIDHCRTHLHDIVKKFKPKVISLQGALPMKELVGLEGLLPSKRNNAPKRGYTFDIEIAGHKCLAVPTVHPSWIIQGNQHMAGVHMWDLSKAVNVANKGEELDEYHYIEHPTYSAVQGYIKEAKQYAERENSLIVADIETSDSPNQDESEYANIRDSEITCVSFAFKEGHAITIPYHAGTHDSIQKLFDLPFTYLGWWNLDFDVPRLTSKGMTFKPKHIDGMLAWHWLQSDVPKGLGFVSTFFTPFREWKSLSDSKPEFYSCRDADATLRNINAIKKLIQTT